MPSRRALLAALLAATTAAPARAAAATAAATQARRRKHAARPALQRSPAPPRDLPFGASDDITQFAADVAGRRKLPQSWLLTQLAQARRVDVVRKLILPPPAGTAKNWAAYRALFIEPQRIAAGLAFWRDNGPWLDQAEQQYGVPPHIVAGIIGVETFYGRVTGDFRVLDALATLAFAFPPGRRDRSAFFRDELEEFFVFCAREGADPQALKGSFAGAMGLPQFMPSSINRRAVDLDGNGHIDLLGSPADAIGSVANYLADAGWQRGLPTHFEVAPPVDAADRAALLAGDIVPAWTAAQFDERGAVLDAAGRAYTGPLALVELQNGLLAPSFVAGTQNFYVVTRYNRSSYYAMAVIELARALQTQRQ